MVENYISIIEQTEKGGFATHYKDLTVEALVEVLADFLALFAYGHAEGRSEDLISFDDWLAFSVWDKDTQSDFLAYLTAKIAMLQIEHLLEG
jgi:hypothetical protein